MIDAFDDELNDEDLAYLSQHLAASAALVASQTAHAPLFAAEATKEALLHIPAGFEMRMDGIHAAIEKKSGEIDDLRVCGPLAVVASARTHGGQDWRKLVHFIDRDGNTREVLLNEADLAGGGKTIAKRLAKDGLDVAGTTEANKQLLLLLNRWNPKGRIFLTDRLGWVDETFSAFILGTGRVIGDDKYRPVFDVSAEHQRASSPRGSLTHWQRDVAGLCVGNPLMIVAVSLALLGPLLQPLRIENFGLHLRGASSSGKSTLQRLACSVWGSADLKRSWNGTRAGVEAIAARHSGTLLVLDELAEVAPGDVEATIYGLGNGSGRSRGTTTGGAQATATWRLPILSSGEISIEAHMARAGATKRAGIEMRLLDIPADEQTYRAFDALHGQPDGAGFARSVDLVVAANHGTAGPAFVESVRKVGPGIVEKFPFFEENFKRGVKRRLGLTEDPLIERALTKFAAIAYAGEIAAICKVTGWEKGKAIAAAFDVFKLWLENRQASTRAEIKVLLAPLRTFVSTHGGTGFIDLVGPYASTSPVRFGWRDAGAYYFTPSAFESACRPQNVLEVLDLLDRQGMLKKNNGTGKQSKMPPKVPGRPVAYVVKREVFDETL